MSTNSTTIEVDLNTVLQNKSFDDFTVMQLRDGYLKILVQKESPVKARQFVYRQILRLVRLGLLKKTNASNNRDSTYSKTEKFFGTQFETRSFRDKTTTFSVKAKPSVNINKNKLAVIEEQLKQYNVNLLASVGESEEYMRLYQSNPEFKTLLESEYLQARDQSSKLLGQIKALKTVLTHYSN